MAGILTRNRGGSGITGKVKEAERMVSEKVAANMALGVYLMTGKLGTSPEQIVSGSIAHYSRRVRRNRERLAK